MDLAVGLETPNTTVVLLLVLGPDSSIPRSMAEGNLPEKDLESEHL